MEIITLHTGLLSVNTYIVPAGGDAVFAVDPGGNPDLIFETCSKINKKLTAVFLTHGHFDHLGALPEITSSSKKNNIPLHITVHSDDSRYFGKNSLQVHKRALESLGFDNIEDFISQDIPQPDIFVKGGETIYGEWKVLHTPGHSPGSSCLYSSAHKVLLSGDTLFYGTWGRTDLDGGSDREMKNSLDILFDLPPDTKVYPGHGKSGFLLSQTFR